MKKSFAIVLLLAMVLSLAACGEAAPAATPEPTAEPTPAPEILAAEAEELFYKAELNILMDIDGLNDLAFKPRSVDFVDVALYLVLVPNLARSLIVQKAHDAGHAGDLLYLFQCNAVAV